MKTLLVAGLLLMTGMCPAGEMYKCVGKGGAVSIQDYSCAATSQTKWVKEASSDPRGEYGKTYSDNQIARQQRDAAYLSSLAGTDRSRTVVYTARPTDVSRGARCQEAKDRRNHILRLNPNANYDTRRTLDDRVYDACK